MQYDTHSSSGPYLMALESKVSEQDARIAELTAEVALLGELVSCAEGIFQNYDVVSCMCACGDAMDRHSNHHYDHSPRDIAVSSVDSWLEQAYIARNALKDGV